MVEMARSPLIFGECCSAPMSAVVPQDEAFGRVGGLRSVRS